MKRADIGLAAAMSRLEDAFTDLLESLGVVFWTRHVITCTIFQNIRGTRLRKLGLTLERIAKMAVGITRRRKDHLPLIKFADFGDEESSEGSLRHDENVRGIFGVEGDHDTGDLSFDEAVELLRSADLAAVVHETPSSTTERERYRLLLLTSTCHEPAKRELFAARLNGVVRGHLAPESFGLSQTFYLGRVKGQPRPRVALIDGRPIDLASDLDEHALGRDGLPYIYPSRTSQTARQDNGAQPHSDPETPENIARVRTALSHLSADCPYAEWRDNIFALKSTSWTCSEDLACEWSMSAPGRYSEEAFRKVWDHSVESRIGGRTLGSIFYLAKRRGWLDPVLKNPDQPDTGGDISLGREFALNQRDNLLYVQSDQVWRYFDGVRWAPSETGQHVAAAKSTIDAAVRAASLKFGEDPSDSNRARQTQAVRMHRSAQHVNAVLKMGAHEPGLSVASPPAFDTDPMLFCVKNGAIDLRNGVIVTPLPSLMLARQGNVYFDPDAKCPNWRRALEQIFGSNEIAEFVQRAVGYTLTGLTDEEKLFFAYGSGANGKSLFANVVSWLMGEYAVSAGVELLARSNHDGEGRHHKALLPGARMVLVNEVGHSDVWDDQRVKELVSRERLSARQLYGRVFNFNPTHTIWIRGNHKPGVLDAGDAMWRRLVLIPFTRQFSPEEQIPDLDRQIFEQEASGILNWAIEGCLAWQRLGLRIPMSIQREVNAYRSETDILGEWIRECCTSEVTSRTEIRHAYQNYKQYCIEGTIRPPAQMSFTRLMQDRGFKVQPSNGRRYLLGLSLFE